MKTLFSPPASLRKHHGFSLIELMIGITISLLGLAAVSGIMMTFSSKRSSITSTLAAQDSGVMALYRMERDITQAGYGLMHLQRCVTINDAAASFNPYPFAIGDGGASASDTLIVQYANTRSGSPGTELTADGSGMTVAANQYNLLSAAGFEVLDHVVSSVGAPTCKITRITGTRKCTLTSAGPPKAYACATATYAAGPPAGVTTATDTQTGNKPQEWIGHDTAGVTSSASSGYLANLGKAGEFIRREYSIANGALMLREYDGTNAEGLSAANVLVNDIVFMKAQYGLAPTTWNGSVCVRAADTVTSWVNGSQLINEQNSCGVIAARVGLVARAAYRESTAVELANGNALEVLPAALDENGTEMTAAVTYDPGADRTRYRHRIYSTTIPLKNVIWTR